MCRCVHRLTLLLQIVLSLLLCAQPRFSELEHPSLDQDFSRGYVYDLVQDAQGFLWIASEQGLLRYDGYTLHEFIHHPRDPHSIGSNNVRCLYQHPADSGKVLWVGTWGGGLNRLDLQTGRFRRYRHIPGNPNALSHDDVNCIFRDQSGILWIGTDGGGLNRFNERTGIFTAFRHDPHDEFMLSHNRVLTDNLSHNSVFAICQDRAGSLWVGTRWGLNRMVFDVAEEPSPQDEDPPPAAAWTNIPSADVWSYDPADPEGGWRGRADMPTQRWGAASLALDGRIYVIGGFGGDNTMEDPPGLTTVEAYDPRSDTWERCADMSAPRGLLTASVVNGTIYAVGGGETVWKWETSPPIVEAYRPAENRWIRKRDVPTPRTVHGAAVIDKKIFVLGGSDGTLFEEGLRSVAVYDPATDRWTSAPNLPVGREFHATAVVDGRIYLIGGMFVDSGDQQAGVQVYHPPTGTTADIADLPDPRDALAATVLRNDIWVMGGHKRLLAKRNVLRYRPLEDRWTPMPDLPVARALMTASAIDGKIYLFGGTASENPDTGTASPPEIVRTTRFFRYQSDQFDRQSLPGNFVLSLHVDRHDSLWVGTAGALSCLNRGSNNFERFDLSGGDPLKAGENSICDLFESADGIVWAATQRGLFRIDLHKGESLQYNEHAQNSRSEHVNLFRTVIEDRSGVIWAGSLGEGLHKLILRRKPFRHYQYLSGDPAGLSDSRVQALKPSVDGRLWVATAGGRLDRLDPRQQTFQSYPFDNRNAIGGIDETPAGRLWLAKGRGLTKFDPATGERINYASKWFTRHTRVTPEALASIDRLRREATPLAAIERVGNDRYLTADFDLDHPQEVLAVVMGEGVFNEMRDRGWITRRGSEELVWQSKVCRSRDAGGATRNVIAIKALSLPPGRYRAHFRSNHEHAYGQWIANPPPMPELWGISIFPLPPGIRRQLSPTLDTQIYPTDILSINGLHSVICDRYGRIWCLIDGVHGKTQAYLFDESRREFSRFPVGFDGNIAEKITLMYEGRRGDLWFGSERKGLFRLDNRPDSLIPGDLSRFQRFRRIDDDPQSLSSNRISAICEDSAGSFWVATDNGLNRLQPRSGTAIRYDQRSGLPPGQIYSVIADDDDHIWFSTDRGLSKLHTADGSVRSFDASDGLPEGGGRYAVCGKTADGTLCFGGEKGLLAFQPESLTANPRVPPVVLTDFRLFNKPVLPGADSPLPTLITRSDTITLAHDQDVFSIEFAALDFTSPDKNQYAYQLEGVDRDWVYTDASRRFAAYTRLAPGEYRFRVKAANNDGVWNEKSRELRIIITPPWWRTGWAFAAYFLTVVALLYGAWHFQMSRVKLRHRAEMEHLQVEKYQELDRLKSRFFANISHEFRTPLTLILGPLETLMAQTGSEPLRDTYQIMARSGRRLQRLINQLLDLSRLESGKMTLQAAPHDLDGMLRPMVMAFESLAGLRETTLSYQGPPAPLRVYVDRDKFEKIITNLLSNAFKFTPPGGEITVDIPPILPSNGGAERGMWQVHICDTGSGIPEGVIERIFDRFYQADDSCTRAQEGSGIGLALTRELVTLHHGRISVESEDGRGSCFIIHLPLGSAHLRPEEIASRDDGPAAAPAEAIKSSIQESPLTDGDDRESSAQDDLSGPPRAGQGATVLIVEDNTDLRRYLRSHLDADYRVIEASDGALGLQAARKAIPDLVVSDVMMPQMDGLALCEVLKTDERTSHIPVILLTARADAESRITGLQTGADDYLAKPFNARELLVRIANLIAQREKLRERFRRDIDLSNTAPAITSTDERFLQRAVELVNTHLAESDFGVAEFVDEIGMSHMQLHRKLRALTGRSAGEFIRTLRLQRAARLLENHYGNVTEIAYAVGFNNLSYFAGCFRKQFGVPPSQYRREYEAQHST